MNGAPPVVDFRDAQRLEIAVDGQVAFAEYRVDAQVMTFIHTFVPEALRRRGLATRLVEAGLQAARSQGLKVLPQCSVFSAYMQRHPETQDLLAAR